MWSRWKITIYVPHCVLFLQLLVAGVYEEGQM